VVPFAEDLDGANIHVRAPTAVVLLCGGQYSDLSVTTPLSLRDAFLKILDNPALKNRHLIQAEDITKLSVFSEHYRDLLQFETDFAQITELILLFCESEGSFAELGAFAVVPEIAARLLVVVRDTDWENDSFIKLGPLRYLERKHGQTAVFVIDDQDVDMRGKSAANVKIGILKERLQEPLRLRLEKTRDPTTFDRTRPGHVMKLIVGLIQEYGALTVQEILFLLAKFEVSEARELVEAYLLCVEKVDWILGKRKGSKIFMWGGM
jgi:hypothetical protein